MSFDEPFKTQRAVIALALIISAIVGAFSFGVHYANTQNENAVMKERAAQTALWQKKLDTERDRLNAISLSLETKMETLRPVYTTINRKVEREVQKQIYTDPKCALPQSGVELINQNVTDLNIARKAKK